MTTGSPQFKRGDRAALDGEEWRVVRIDYSKDSMKVRSYHRFMLVELLHCCWERLLWSVCK